MTALRHDPVLRGPVIIVTRPEPQARQWVRDLQARGIAATALPLISIEPLESSSELVRWRDDGGWHAVMFVSAEAVRHFFDGADAGWLAAWGRAEGTPRAWCTGPGTEAALLARGVSGARIDRPADQAPQWDSEALWARVGCTIRPGLRVLIVRGGDAQGRVQGRDWLARQLAQAGASVFECVAYRRRGPDWSPADLSRARAAATDGSVWLFSSSEAVRHLCALCPAQDWSGARALATHPRIAAVAREAGFGTVGLTRPEMDAVVASIESFA